MRFRKILRTLRTLSSNTRLWLLLLLACCCVLAGAQEPDKAPETADPPKSVDEKIEELMGPTNAEEEKPSEGEAKSTEPVLYIADTDNGRICVMQGLDGTGFSSIGIPGYGFGRFLRPAQVWVDYKRRLYVADSGNDRVIRIDQEAKDPWTEIDGLSSPMGVAVDKSGVYISDTKADRILRVKTVEKGAKVEEVLTHPQLTRPTSLWIDSRGALYACCGEDPPGGKVFKTWMDKDRRRWEIFEGTGLSGSRFRPSSLVTAGSNVRLVDGSGFRVVTMKGMDGKRVKEQPFRDNRHWRLKRPQGLAVDSSGKRFFIADSGNDRILEVRSDGSVVQEFTQLEGDPNSALRNPTSVFVYSPAPEPEPEPDKDEKHKEE